MAELTVTSEIEEEPGSYDKYPKEYVVTIDRNPDDLRRVVITRSVTNMSGMELYGLLMVLTESVRQQVMFPLDERSDGLTIPSKEKDDDH